MLLESVVLSSQAYTLYFILIGGMLIKYYCQTCLVFCRRDNNKTHWVTPLVQEFLSFFGEEEHPHTFNEDALKALFQAFDTDGNGKLSKEEISNAFRAWGTTILLLLYFFLSSFFLFLSSSSFLSLSSFFRALGLVTVFCHISVHSLFFWRRLSFVSGGVGWSFQKDRPQWRWRHWLCTCV